MKNNWKLLWNPFVRVAGWQAFLIGIIVVIFSAVIGKFGNLIFDGAMDVHFYDDNITIWHSIIVTIIDVVSLSGIMTAGAFILTKDFRIIDILGTTTLARAPLFLLSVFALFVTKPDLNEIMKNPMTISMYPTFLFFSFMTIPVMIWYIALIYNAFKVSTGIKGNKMIAVFIAALIVSEILSKVILMIIY